MRSVIPWEDLRDFCFDEILNLDNDTLFEVYSIIAKEKSFIKIGNSYTKWNYTTMRKRWQDSKSKQLTLF